MSDYRHKYTLTVTATIATTKKLDRETLASLISDEWNLSPAKDRLVKWSVCDADKPEIDVRVHYKKFDIKVS